MKLNRTVLCSKTRLLRLSEMSRVCPVRNIRQFSFNVFLLFNWKKNPCLLIHVLCLVLRNVCFCFINYKNQCNWLIIYINVMASKNIYYILIILRQSKFRLSMYINSRVTFIPASERWWYSVSYGYRYCLF